MNPSKRVVICPLNWGLGHASRCVPIIQSMQSSGHEVMVAADGLSAIYLKNRFPNIKHLSLPGYTIKYSRTSSLNFTLAKQIPSMLKSLEAERARTKEIVEEYHPDLIISDNRYGVYHPGVKSVLITHQVDPITPKAFRGVSRLLIKTLLEPFDEVWIPDEEACPMSGELSRGKKSPKIKAIGPLSRFMGLEASELPFEEETFDVLAIISGPEPRRSQLENKLTQLLAQKPGKHALICGTPGKFEPHSIGHLLVLPDANDASMFAYLSTAKTIISGAGYSSLMDLRIIGRGAYIIPTKGQSEQEYLASFNNGKHGFIRLDVEELDGLLLEASVRISNTSPVSELSGNLNRVLGG